MAPSVPLWQFDESNPLALWDSQDPHRDGFTVFGTIRPPGRAEVHRRKSATCSFCSTLCLALSHCLERPSR